MTMSERLSSLASLTQFQSVNILRAGIAEEKGRVVRREAKPYIHEPCYVKIAQVHHCFHLAARDILILSTAGLSGNRRKYTNFPSWDQFEKPPLTVTKEDHFPV